MTLKDLEKVLYCEAYIVLDPKSTELEQGRADHRREVPASCSHEHGDDVLRGGHGRRGRSRHAQGDRRRHSSPRQLRDEMKVTTSEAKRKKIAKRLKVLEAFRSSGPAGNATSPSG